MAHSEEVPITPAVLGWAIEQSGYEFDALAKVLKVGASTLRSWTKGLEKPNVTQFKNIASKLKRPQAFFLLPEPPEDLDVQVSFRHPPNATRTELTPTERRYLRDAARMQRAVGWIVDELDGPRPRLSKHQMNGNAESVGAQARADLGVDVFKQVSWPSASQALKEWRGALERKGVLVFLLSMGGESSRGFSLWDGRAPVIAANTWWNPEARIFTLFHEYGHLLTRTDSVCSSYGKARSSLADPAERWCESFAAAFLLPWAHVSKYLETNRGWREGRLVTDLDDARAVARRFKVSLRASVLRLIDHEAATWDLYREIPPITDDKPQTGGGGKGRARERRQEDKYGRRTRNWFVSAVSQDVMSKTDALSLMDVPASDFDRWQDDTES
jgi:Zn-dependent peptidase ImmA (M78 family)